MEDFFMAKVTDVVAALALPFVEEAGCSLWDVEYVKEAGEWFLRVYIDKEGGVSIEDCEAVSRPLSDKLDEADPIEGGYTFEVSSAGCDRALKKPEHFAQFQNAEVEVKLYRPREGRKEFVGLLRAYEGGDVTLDMDGTPARFEKKEIALVRLYPRF
jgi:ribosome maturation factor RimP